MKHFALTTAALVLATTTAASALTIDTNPTWDGNINSGWTGSGQSITVDLVENTLDTISFYFDADSAGMTFDFRISDAVTGGSDYYSTSFVVAAGINTFAVNTALAAGSMVYAMFDYNGFGGKTAHFSNIDGYAGGHSYFLAGGSWDSTYVSLDHRFIADFSGAQIPLPAGLPLMISALLAGGLVTRKRRKS